MELDPKLDRKFAWRWLLPVVRGDHLLLLGFTKHEVAFWEQALTETAVTDDPGQATVWLINALPPDCVARLSREKLRCLCVVEPRQMVSAWRSWMASKFADIRDFALLPSRSSRLVVPLGKSEWVIKGLGLHRPGRWVARLALVSLKILVRLGIDRPLRDRVVCIANTDVNILPRGARQSGLELSGLGGASRFALYLGTPDNNRKTVILRVSGTRKAILKQGESREARASLRKEAAALKAISLTPLASQVPELIKLSEQTSSVTLHQEYRPRQRRAAAGIRGAATKFLVELSRQGRCVRPLGDVLVESNLMTATEARAVGQAAYSNVRDRLDELASNDTEVLGYRSHGDFAPWNCSWTSAGFFVFDWEESKAWDVALDDAFYFMIAPVVLLRRSLDTQEVRSGAWDFANFVLKEIGLPATEIHIYWALWLLRRSSRQPHKLYTRLLDSLWRQGALNVKEISSY